MRDIERWSTMKKRMAPEQLERLLKDLAEGRAHDMPEMEELITSALEIYGDSIRDRLKGRYKDVQLAEEVFSHFTIRLIECIDKFQAIGSLHAWLRTVADNVANDYDRKRKRNREQADETLDMTAGASLWSTRTATKPWKRTTAKDKLSEVRNQLSADEQRLLVLRVDRRLSWNDVANAWTPAPGNEEEIKKLAGTLKKRFSRLQDKLKNEFRKAGMIKDTPK